MTPTAINIRYPLKINVSGKPELYKGLAVILHSLIKFGFIVIWNFGIGVYKTVFVGHFHFW